jgi:hypothetical protein
VAISVARPATPGDCTVNSVLGGYTPVYQGGSAKVNRVISLTAAPYNASGSDETMTCTTRAGSNTLTCSGGTADFKVGQTIVIKGAGNNPTVPTPSAPTLTAMCSGTGCSTTGSTVYSYEIVETDGDPDGATTAASAAATITQATQYLPGGTYTNNPSVFTRVCAPLTPPPSSGASTVFVYKSTNSGPYSLYDAFFSNRSSSYCFDDFGHGTFEQFTSFQPADFDMPSSPPSTATPNDVYGVITAISGTSVTIGAIPSPVGQPVQVGSNTPLPSTPEQAITATVYHNDAPAFQLAVYNLRQESNPGTVELYAGPGNYELFPGNSIGGQPDVINVDGLKNVSLDGAGHATQFNLHAWREKALDQFADSGGVCAGKQPVNISCLQNQSSTLPFYYLVDPALVGQSAVTLSTPSESSHFAPGDIVALGIDCTNPSSQCYPSVYPGYLRYEYNVIQSVNSTTGVLGLQYPLEKSFSNASAVNTGLPSGYWGAAYAGVPFIVNNKDSDSAGNTGFLTAQNIAFKNFDLRGPIRTLTAIGGAWGIDVEDVNADTLYATENGEDWGQTFRNDTITREDASGFGFAVGASTSDVDALFEDTTFNVVGMGGQTCTESASDVTFRHDTIITTGYPVWASESSSGGDSEVLMGLNCANFDVLDNMFEAFGTSLQDFVRSSAIGHIDGNRFITDSIGPAVSGSDSPSIETFTNGNGYNTFNNNTEQDFSNSGYTLGGGYAPASRTPLAFGSGTVNSSYAAMQNLNVGITTQVVKLTLTTNTSMAFYMNNSGPTPGVLFLLEISQPASGGPYTLSWPTNWFGVAVKYLNGVSPLINPAPGAVTYIEFLVNDSATEIDELFDTYQGGSGVLQPGGGPNCVASGSTVPVSVRNVYPGNQWASQIIFVNSNDNGAGRPAMAYLSGAAVEGLVGSPLCWSTASGNSGTSNLYYDPGRTSYVIQNETGNTVCYSWAVIGGP